MGKGVEKGRRRVLGRGIPDPVAVALAIEPSIPTDRGLLRALDPQLAVLIVRTAEALAQEAALEAVLRERMPEAETPAALGAGAATVLRTQLPKPFAFRYDREFMLKMTVCILEVERKLLEMDAGPLPSCTAEELALRAVLNTVEGMLGDRHAALAEVLDALRAEVFWTSDHELLFDRGGLRALTSPDMQEKLGYANPFDWFAPLGDQVPHPYLGGATSKLPEPAARMVAAAHTIADGAPYRRGR